LPDLFKPSCTDSSPNNQEPSDRIFAPENASLAQKLLWALLENARIEMFSPEGGGVVLMRLDRWQIDLLENYGIKFEHFPIESQIDSNIPTQQSECLKFYQNSYSVFLNKLSVFSVKSTPSDILSEWLKKK